ncbi:MAG: ATP synthase F1 subunit gamma [Caldilineae bacterium]|nr:MAG: ATP synthase F1 subunit gamma [Caldilineae bacterium]
MATERDIKRRIRSVKNISQVTRAMEAVSASKMRRAQAQVEATRPYARKAHEVLAFLSHLRSTQAAEQPLLQAREIKRVALLLITADRGLAGGLNSNMIRVAAHHIQQWQREGKEVELVTVGRKGRDWMRRYGPPIRAEFTGIGDRPSSSVLAKVDERAHSKASSVGPIARIVIEDFVNERYDAVYIGYTRFYNTIRQEPQVVQLLPIEIIEEEEALPANMAADYIFEPDAPTVLNQVLYSFTEVQILQALYEAIASEHSARMVAMRNATDAAEELIGDLTLTYNKARQQSITMALLDISGAVNAVQAR